jgi:hypothetical protein
VSYPLTSDISQPLANNVRRGFYSAMLAAGGWYFSPIYRNLTLQFKVYLQMSGMTIGGCLEADRRVRDYERSYRHRRKLKRDAEVWRRYEQQYAQDSQQSAGKPVDKIVRND